MLGLFSPRIFLGAAQRRSSGRGVPVFAYHKIAPPPAQTRDPFLYVSPERFEEQLAALRRAGFVSASLSEVRGVEDYRARKAVITFDDGCRNVLEHGLESLSRHGFRAIQFLVPAFLGRRNEWDIAKGDTPEALMDEGEVRQWLAAGHEIGSHSMTHRNLRHVDQAGLREEISDSRKSLEDRFGVRVEHFCYPYGAWNEAARDTARDAGYATACTMDFGVNNRATPAFELRRIFPLSSVEMLGKIRHRLARKIRRS
jgi:peptidoglycan/xylan/chitin deacetylase (PgdA/CDA1 family)